MRISILLFALLLSASAAFAQGPIPPDGQLQAAQAERESPRKAFPLQFKNDVQWILRRSRATRMSS
jgi:hypothetical protein